MKATMLKKIAVINTKRIILVAMALVIAVSPTVNARTYEFRGMNAQLWHSEDCGPSSTATGSAPTGQIAGEDPTEGEFKSRAGNGHRMIFVHTTEGDSAEAAITTLKSKGFAYHTLIEKDGTELRLVADDQIASGTLGANRDGLAVALVGIAGDGSHFDPKSPQLQTLSKRIAQWSEKYDIPMEKVSGAGIMDGGTTKGVAGHIDAAEAAPGLYAGNGRTDPGKNFPYPEVLANAKADGGGGGSTSAGSSSGSDSCCAPAGSVQQVARSTGDGGGCGVHENGSQENKDQVWAYFNKKFKEAGYSTEEAEKATAGIMGNWEQESAFNPARSDGMGCGTYAAFGIAQWCGRNDRHGNRIGELEEYAKKVGQEATCLGVQLEHSWTEMVDRKLDKGMKGVSPREAAHIFNLGGNGAGGFEIGADDDKRQNYAEKLYTEYTGKSAGSVGERGSSSGGNCASAAGSTSAANGSIASVATQMGAWGGESQACYETGGGHGSLEDLKERIDKKFVQGYGVDCSGFVRAVIYQSTGKDTGGLSTDAMCVSDQYEKIPRSQAQPGDIAIQCTTHTEVITEVNDDGSFKTVGSHSSGCGPGKGPSPANYQGTEDFVLRFKGAPIQV